MPTTLYNFVGATGVSKTNGTLELAMLEHFLREDLNKKAPRVMAVLRPLKVVIDCACPVSGIAAGGDAASRVFTVGFLRGYFFGLKSSEAEFMQ